MTSKKEFDVIIIGGSYSGLSAAMALGRALRQVLIIDDGNPCNIQTPHSHNFITQDGKTPKEILSAARIQVKKYESVIFYTGIAASGKRKGKGFEIMTQSGDNFISKKIIFATGVKDIMPNIKGFSDCWGISVIHCPYCHGYEYSNAKTGILANGDIGFEMSRLISNWTKELTLFTNQKSALTIEQTEKLSKHNIHIIEIEIDRFEHTKGQIENILLKDGSKFSVKAIYARPAFEQHCSIPAQLGCELTEQNHIKVDAFQKTTVAGIFACGDNTTALRTISNAVAMGNLSGAMANKEIIDEAF